MTQEPKLPLCEAICGEIDSHTLLIGYDSAKAIVRKHFAALSVEELSDVIDDGLVGVEVHSSVTRSIAQAVMQLLRKE